MAFSLCLAVAGIGCGMKQAEHPAAEPRAREAEATQKLAADKVQARETELIEKHSNRYDNRELDAPHLHGSI